MIRTKTRILAAVAFTALCSAVVVCIGGWYVVTDSRTELREEQQHAAYLRVREADLAQLERELVETKTEREELGKLLIEPEFVIEFLGLLETLGASYGTEVTTASIDVAEELPLLDILQIDIKASGSFEGVQNVLTLLETLPYVSKVAGVSVSAGTGEEAVWEGDFTLMIAKHKDI